MVTMAASAVNTFVRALGWRTATSGTRYFPTTGATLQNWTLVGWVDFTKDDYVSAFAAAAGLAESATTQSTAIRSLGMIGMESAGDRYGKIYSNPELSTTVAKSPNYVIGQGGTHLAVRVAQVSGTTRTTTLYVNGVPLYDDTDTVDAPTPGVLIHGENTIFGGMSSPDRYANVQLFETALTEDEISALYLSERAALGLSAPKMFVVGSFDSLTSFSPAPFWDLVAAPSLRPGIFGMLDAIGGSKYGSETDSAYESAGRQGLRRRTLKYAAAHFQQVDWLCAYGTNDLSGGVMDPATTTWQAGRDTIDAMIAADVATVPSADRGKVKPVLVTIIPNGRWIDSSTTAVDEAKETARLAYNTDCRDNFASRGFDALLDPASYVPDGFASMEAAAIDASDAVVANGMYGPDGLHYSDDGGAEMAAGVHIPFISTRMGGLA